ncbi:hypothetical protein SELMODRAFT_228450 [Selaginella moellendorffii]|uniref:Germin-like protein n=1 Tax=Selaginella moellendorffii TaxID=88036 RepID=D8S187_SELML|nr:germin-like protein 1-1 [Selaginella moellendorffii]EFJ21800.1 hypothetical protein SELMODRAFT_228450 [Selaginella moellendorffii]|eukprot:XP_024537959.1 germin-like protein 1-1 [Selaginella moellendorffii]
MAVKFLVLVIASVLGLSGVLGADPDPLQDFCVAVKDNKINISPPKSKKDDDKYDHDKDEESPYKVQMSTTNSSDISVVVNVNGAICKNPAMVTGDDFLFKNLVNLGDANNMVGSIVTPANIGMFLGLNTLGISFARIDFKKGGVNPPHTHPRATEILLVIDGSLKVGFVATNNKLFTATVNKNEIFVFPRGLVHFQENVGYGTALAFAALSSQNPGTQQIAPSLFGADPPISDSVLAKAFGLKPEAVDALQVTFSKDKESSWSNEK